jgi:diaminopimelate decarboxylase
MTLVPSTVVRQAGILHVDGVSLQHIAERFDTPCWVYSGRMIVAAWQAYDNAFGEYPHQVCYAVKANGTLALLQLLARAGAGFDIVSGGELERVLAAGADPARIVFSGVAKSVPEMREALAHGIGCFNVESAQELDTLDAVAREMGLRAPVALRINPDIDVDTHPYIATGLTEHKFGIPIGEARPLYHRASTLAGIRLAGIACHIGSQIVSLDAFARAAEAVLALAQDLRSDGICVEHLDLGGGLGLDSDKTPSPGIAAYVERLVATARAAGDPPYRLIIEPGRSIVAEAGLLLTRVRYLKDNGARHFALVDAGMNDLLRPALYGAWQPVWPVRTHGAQVPPITCDVVGPVCESADVLARDRTLAVAPGDVLAIGEAGAYGVSMSSQYNGRPRGAEVLVMNGDVQLIREREQYADLMRGERDLDAEPQPGALSARAAQP